MEEEQISRRIGDWTGVAYSLLNQALMLSRGRNEHTHAHEKAVEAVMLFGQVESPEMQAAAMRALVEIRGKLLSPGS